LAAGSVLTTQPPPGTTISESPAIADAGKSKPAAAEADLQKIGTELRDTLAAAHAPVVSAPSTQG
jgi:hypothetical protein